MKVYRYRLERAAAVLAELPDVSVRFDAQGVGEPITFRTKGNGKECVLTVPWELFQDQGDEDIATLMRDVAARLGPGESWKLNRGGTLERE